MLLLTTGRVQHNTDGGYVVNNVARLGAHGYVITAVVATVTDLWAQWERLASANTPYPNTCSSFRDASGAFSRLVLSRFSCSRAAWR
jgi:hypothetical protein